MYSHILCVRAIPTLESTDSDILLPKSLITLGECFHQYLELSSPAALIGKIISVVGTLP